MLSAAGARIIATPVDAQGIDVSSFAAKSAKLVYVTPSHQFPACAVLSLDRRLQLLDWANRNDAWILEDDYDSEFNYTNRPLPALQGLGGNARVIYVGTFSKVLAPSIRVGYVVVPEPLVDAFRAVRMVTGGSADALMQAAIARFIDDGHFGRRIARMRKPYDERRKFVVDLFGRVRGGMFRVRDTSAGLHVIAELPPGVRDADYAMRARAMGILVPPLSEFFYGRPTLNGIIVGFAATSKPQAVAGLKSLLAAQ